MFAQLCCKHFSVQRTEYPWNVLIYLVNKALDRSSMYTCSLLFFTPLGFILFVAFFFVSLNPVHTGFSLASTYWRYCANSTAAPGPMNILLIPRQFMRPCCPTTFQSRIIQLRLTSTPSKCIHINNYIGRHY